MFAFPLLVQFDLVLLYDRIELCLRGAHFPLLRFVFVQPDDSNTNVQNAFVSFGSEIEFLSAVAYVAKETILLSLFKTFLCTVHFIRSARHRKLFKTLSLISTYHSSDFFASSNRPLETSHTGDSGTKNCTKIIGTTA